MFGKVADVKHALAERGLACLFEHIFWALAIVLFVSQVASAAVIRVTPNDSLETAVAKLQPGDTLLLGEGVYHQRLVIEGLSGAEGAPIVIRGISRDGVVFDGEGGDPPYDVKLPSWSGDWDFEGQIDLSHCSYVTLESLTVRDVVFFGIDVSESSHITIRNVLVDGAGHGGIIVDADHATITRNEVRWSNQGWVDREGNVSDGDHEAISITGESFDFTVSHNYVHDCLEEGIDVKESSHDGEVRHNTVERAGRVGIYINEAHRVSVFRNSVSHVGWCLINGQATSCREHPVFGPTLFDSSSTGMLLAVGDLEDLNRGRLSEIQVFQNVVWNATGDCLEFWDQLRENGIGAGTIENVRVYNNVFWGCGLSGVRIEVATGTVLANNIFSESAEDALTGDNVEITTITNNLFFQAEPPEGTSPITDDPRVIDSQLGDFQLRADSPAIDRGTDMGLSTRGLPDIGAYEFGLAVLTGEGVVNAASFRAGRVAPGAMVSLFGLSLALQVAAAEQVPLPTTLAGATVEVTDSDGVTRLAPLFFAGPTQINCQIPEESALGPATLRVRTADGGEGMVEIVIEAVAPGLFTANADGQGVVAAVGIRIAGGGSSSTVDIFDASSQPRVARPIDLGPASDQFILLLFGTGLRGFQSSVQVTIGGERAEVLGVAAQTEFVGLDQVNVRIPRALIGRGTVEIGLTVDGAEANPVTVNIR
jgi:uncharacterized protein (TIGR03437 family)